MPGEGAAFMVLEEEECALARGARAYARIIRHAIGTTSKKSRLADMFAALIAGAQAQEVSSIVAAGDGDRSIREAETQAMERVAWRRRLPPCDMPKRFLGNLYSAAAAVQVALSAALAARAGRGRQVLANCFGHGSEQGVFLLEGA